MKGEQAMEREAVEPKVTHDTDVDKEKEGGREELGKRRGGGDRGGDGGGGGGDCQRPGERFLCRRFARGEGCVIGDSGPESADQVVIFLADVLGRIGHGPDQDLHTELRVMAVDPIYSQDVKPALVLCSPPRLLAWAEALERHGSGCLPVIVDGAESTAALAQLLHGDRHHEVAIATYATARLHLHEMNSVQWSMVIVEEPQQPADCDGEAEPRPLERQGQHCDSRPLSPHKDPQPAESSHHATPLCLIGASTASDFHNPWIRDWRTLRAIQCPVRIALAATALRSSLVDLWSVVDWAVPGNLGSIGEFREEFASPIETGRRRSAIRRERHRGRVAARALARRLCPHLLLPRCHLWRGSNKATSATQHCSDQAVELADVAEESVKHDGDTRGIQRAQRAPTVTALTAASDHCCDSGSSEKGVADSLTTTQIHPSERPQQLSLLDSDRFTSFLEEFAEFFEMGSEIVDRASSNSSCSDSEKEMGARRGGPDELRGKSRLQNLRRHVGESCVVSTSELMENFVPESLISCVAETESSHEGDSSNLEPQRKTKIIASAVPDTDGTSSDSDGDRASPVQESRAYQHNPVHSTATLKQNVSRPGGQHKSSERNSTQVKIVSQRQRRSVPGEVSEESDNISISSSDEFGTSASVKKKGGFSVQARAMTASRQGKRIVFERETPEINAFSLSSDEEGIIAGVRNEVQTNNPLSTDTTGNTRERTEPLLPHGDSQPQQEAVAAAGGAPIFDSESRTIEWKGIPVMIGQTPDTIRREHFEAMARHHGLASVHDLATLILHSDRKGRLKIMQDFYTSRHPELCKVLIELYTTGRHPHGEKPPRGNPTQARRAKFSAPVTYDSSSDSDNIQNTSRRTRRSVAVTQSFEDEFQGNEDAYTCIRRDNKRELVPSFSVRAEEASEQERGLICSSADLAGSKQQLCSSRVVCSSRWEGFTSSVSVAPVETGAATRSSTDELSELLGDTSVLAEFFGPRRGKEGSRGGGCKRSKGRLGRGDGKRAPAAAPDSGPVVKMRAKRRDFLDEVLSGDGGADSVEHLMDPSRVDAMARPGLLHQNRAPARGRGEGYDPWDTALWKKNESFFLKRGDV